MKSLPVSHVVPRVPAWPWLSHARRPCTGGVGRPDKVRVISPNKLQFSPPPSDDDLSTALEEDGATQEVAVPSSLDVNPDQLPKHVAIVMDGNVRWAQQRGLAAVSGHQAGVQSLRAAVTCCKQWGIPCLTVFAFSAENWQREEAEVSFLLALIERVLQRELPALVGQGVRMRFIGEVGLLPRSLQAACRAAELATGDNCDVHLTVALSYSSRQDICTAVQDIAHLIAQGEIKPCEVTPSLIASHLSTRQLPTALQEPDLVIRTSGEQRLSNFLLWESAYSELYFAPVCWPDFGEQQFAAAVMDFAARERRFGRRH